MCIYVREREREKDLALRKTKTGHIRIIYYFCPDGIIPDYGLTGLNNT